MKYAERFTAANNSRPLRRGEYRVWRYGESAIFRSRDRAEEACMYAQWVDPDAGVTPYNEEDDS